MRLSWRRYSRWRCFKNRWISELKSGYIHWLVMISFGTNDKAPLQHCMFSSYSCCISYFESKAKPEDTMDLCQILNNDIANKAASYPKRFVCLGTLPMQVSIFTFVNAFLFMIIDCWNIRLILCLLSTFHKVFLTTVYCNYLLFFFVCDTALIPGKSTCIVEYRMKH